MTLPTLAPGVLKVASAFPDPPFDVPPDTGFDAALMTRICAALGLRREPVPFTGEDFDDIFAGLGRDWDAVISGTTITADRAQHALFCPPYLAFDQGVALDLRRHPGVRSTAGLRGLTLGIQRGNTSGIVARKLLAEGAIAGIRYYPYAGIGTALDDLSAGTIGAVVKLAPVLSELIRGRPGLALAFTVPTHEQIAIAVAPGNTALHNAIAAAQATILADPWFAATRAAWFGPDPRGTP